jgi:hypothetical protein
MLRISRIFRMSMSVIVQSDANAGVEQAAQLEMSRREIVQDDDVIGVSRLVAVHVIAVSTTWMLARTR